MGIQCTDRQQLKVLRRLSKDLEDSTLKQKTQIKIAELEERIAAENGEKKIKKKLKK